MSAHASELRAGRSERLSVRDITPRVADARLLASKIMRIIPTGSIPGADGEGLESITLVPGEKRLRITGTPEVVDAVARAALTLDTAELAAPPSPVPLEDRYQDFEETGVTTDELSRRQRTGPLASLEELGGDFWPEDESVDDFISAVREWRSEGGYRPTLNDEDDAEAWNEDE